ncbi:hypothetical protein V2G26_012264 [Clonostachys chloroleuca]
MGGEGTENQRFNSGKGVVDANRSTDGKLTGPKLSCFGLRWFSRCPKQAGKRLAGQYWFLQGPVSSRGPVSGLHHRSDPPSRFLTWLALVRAWSLMRVQRRLQSPTPTTASRTDLPRVLVFDFDQAIYLIQE